MSEAQVQDLQATAPEAEVAPDPLPEDIDLETAEGLMALMDHTLAGLEETSQPITPKAALAAFAEALGEAPPENLGALEAVANVDDPSLEAALEERIAGALRLPTPASQLSIASAALPVVGRMAMGQAQQGARVMASEGAAPVLQAEGSIEQSRLKAVMPSEGPAPRAATVGATEPPLAAKAENSTTAAPKVDLSIEAADPRLTAAAERFSAAVDAAKVAQPGTNAPAAEAVLREVAALTAPQAPQSEGLRLSPGPAHAGPCAEPCRRAGRTASPARQPTDPQP